MSAMNETTAHFFLNTRNKHGHNFAMGTNYFENRQDAQYVGEYLVMQGYVVSYTITEKPGPVPDPVSGFYARRAPTAQ